jgi:hypothetical protein
MGLVFLVLNLPHSPAILVVIVAFAALEEMYQIEVRR